MIAGPVMTALVKTLISFFSRRCDSQPQLLWQGRGGRGSGEGEEMERGYEKRRGQRREVQAFPN